MIMALKTETPTLNPSPKMREEDESRLLGKFDPDFIELNIRESQTQFNRNALTAMNSSE